MKNSLLPIYSLLLACPVLAEDIDVYILSGQSNMSGRVTDGFSSSSDDSDILYYYRTDGPASNNVTTGGNFTTLQRLSTGYYGPEIAFARSLQEASSNKIAIIKISDGGTKLKTDWNSRNTSGNELWNNWLADSEDAIEDLKRDGYTPKVKGFSWFQGEGDSLMYANNEYQTDFGYLINDVVDHLGGLADVSELNVVTALIQDRGDTKHELVRAAQTNVMASNSAWDIIETNSFETFDGTHLDADGVNGVGKRMAEKYLELAGESTGGEEVAFLDAEADAYVRGGSFGDENYGSDTSLMTKTSSNRFTRRAFFKFDPTNLGGESFDLVLQPSKVSADNAVVQLYAVDSDWSESGLTWNNQPSLGSLLETFTVNQSDVDNAISIDVTDYVNEAKDSEGMVSFAFVRPSDEGSIVSFYSKESSNGATLEGVSSSTPEPEFWETTGEVIAEKDAYVRGGSYASNNYGTADVLQLKNANSKNTREIYTQFDVSAVAASSQVDLVLPIASNSGEGTVELHKVSNDSWSESGLTWNNKPSTSGLIETFTIDSNNNGNELLIDVTDYVQSEGDGVVSFALVRTSGGSSVIKIASKEASNGMRLELSN